MLCGACSLPQSAEQSLKENPITISQETDSCPVEEPYKSELANTTWTPIYLKGQKGSQVPGVNDDMVFLRFNDKLQANGMSGDNLFGGEVIIAKNGSFRARQLFSTRRMGKFPQYEQTFMQALHKANRIYVNSASKRLKLLDGDVVLIDFIKTEHIKDK